MSGNLARKALAPVELGKAIADRVLSFPLTDFDDEDRFNPASYRDRLEWLNGAGAPGHFVVGGAGEFFSLTSAEYGAIVATAVDACRGRVPVIAAAGPPRKARGALSAEAQVARIIAPMPIRSNRRPRRRAAIACTTSEKSSRPS